MSDIEDIEDIECQNTLIEQLPNYLLFIKLK